MRMSCNGCRVLRKGCSDDCSIRPCLEWIKSPESQANATVFLAKFYGRAGLMNLINAGPSHLRPAIFKSLLYEACGRIVNPIYGSVGLTWSGNWQLCQNAVEAVLKAAPITRMPIDAAEAKNEPPIKAFDIRHVSKDDSVSGSPNDLHRVRDRRRFKRSAAKSKRSRVSVGSGDENCRSPSHESALSHQSEEATPVPAVVMESRQSCESLDSCRDGGPIADDDEIVLDLTLGFGPINRCVKPEKVKRSEAGGPAGEGGACCKMELGLECSDQ